jgi:hypothetical protein
MFGQGCFMFLIIVSHSDESVELERQDKAESYQLKNQRIEKDNYTAI